MNADTSYDDAVTATLSDTTIDPGIPPGGSYFAAFTAVSGGTVKFRTPGGNDPSINVLPGVIYNIKVVRFWSTGTTGGMGLVGLVKMP